MNIEIQVKGIPSHKDLQHFVRCRADLALRPLRDQISLVSVFVDKTGESEKGVRCLVLVKLLTHPDVVVECSASNLYVAIHRAVDDAGWTLAHSISIQQRDLLHQQCEIIDGKAAKTTFSGSLGSERAA